MKTLRFLPLMILFVLLAMTPLVQRVTYAQDVGPTATVTDTVVVGVAEEAKTVTELPVTPQPKLPFLAGYSPEKLLTLVIGAIIGLTQGLWPGMSVFTLVKKWLKIKDFWANMAVILLTAGLSALSLYLLGYFDVGDVKLSLDMLFGLVYAVYAMSQAGYQWFKGTNKPVLTELAG